MTSYCKYPLATAFFHSEDFKIRHAVLWAAKGSFFVTFYDCILTNLLHRQTFIYHQLINIWMFLPFSSVCANMHVHKEQLWWGSSRAPQFFLRQGLWLTWNLLASWSQGSSCLWLPNSAITSTCHHIQLLFPVCPLPYKSTSWVGLFPQSVPGIHKGSAVNPRVRSRAAGNQKLSGDIKNKHSVVNHWDLETACNIADAYKYTLSWVSNVSWVWRDVSAVRSDYCSCRGPRYNSQQPHGSLQLSATPAPWVPMPSSGFHRFLHAHGYTLRHTHLKYYYYY